MYDNLSYQEAIKLNKLGEKPMPLWLICLCLEEKEKNNNKAEEIIACVRTSEELKSFAGLHSLLSFSIIFTSLASLVGLHFQVLGISPLKRHFTIILPFSHGYSRL